MKIVKLEVVSEDLEDSIGSDEFEKLATSLAGMKWDDVLRQAAGRETVKAGDTEYWFVNPKRELHPNTVSLVKSHTDLLCFRTSNVPHVKLSLIEDNTIDSVEKALRFVEDNGEQAAVYLTLAVLAKQVEYYCKEDCECPVWNAVTTEQCIEIAKQYYRWNSNEAGYRESIQIFIEETLGRPTVD